MPSPGIRAFRSRLVEPYVCPRRCTVDTTAPMVRPNGSSVLFARTSSGTMFACRGIFGNESCQEVLSESIDVVPVGVLMVPRRVGTQTARFVPDDPLHHVALEETVLAVEQRAAKQTDLGGMP